MKRFFAKIGRFFWSWGFLKFVLGVVLLIILFYVEEDWRGARAWAATKAEWEAKGESFDYSKFIPPPVPDDQNLAAIPLFKLEPDPKNKGDLAPLALDRATHRDIPDVILPMWRQKDGQPDFEQIHQDIASSYAKIFGHPPSNSDPLAQFEALYPFIAELNAASATRPFFRLAEDYTSQPPYGRTLTLLTPPNERRQDIGNARTSGLERKAARGGAGRHQDHH